MSTEVFKEHFESLYDRFWHNLTSICSRVPDCKWPVDGLPFAGFTINVDDVCICDPHVDGSNPAWGLCLICPFGRFNHTAGGHLVLHELKLILELEPGSIALIPSALITHQNVPIAFGEQRHAFTAYTPARMFQWVDCGFKLQKELNLSEAKKIERGKQVWKDGRKRFPHFSQLAKIKSKREIK
jgi:hypothetical protein